MSLLEAQGLRFAYEDRVLLDGVDLEARPGEVLAVVGPNGVGKTTLLRLLGGRLRPSAGEVRLDGRSVHSLSRRQIARRIAVSPQFEHPAWQLTVAQVVLLGRAPHRGWLLPFRAEDQEAARRALDAVELGPLAQRPVTELSGGELRRLLFARILAQEPAVVLLDEPTAHLDLKHQEEVLHLMADLAHQRGAAVVVTLHDLSQAAAYADRVALLHNGGFPAVGPPAEVLRSDLLEKAYGIGIEILHHEGRTWVGPRR